MTAARVAALVLAAGASSRMAPRNKLLLRDRQGVAMVERVVRGCCDSRLDDIVVVTGHDAEAVRQAVVQAGSDARVRCLHAPDHARGMSASLVAGLADLAGDVSAAMICLGDMPLVDGATIDAILDVFAPSAGRPIVVPVHDGRRGHPVLWARRFFGEMSKLEGDQGARALLARHAALVWESVVETPAVLIDFDAPGDLDGRFQ